MRRHRYLAAAYLTLAVALALAGYVRASRHSGPGRVLFATTGPDAVWGFDVEKGRWARLLDVVPGRAWHAWTDSAQRVLLALSGREREGALTLTAVDPTSGAVLLEKRIPLGACSRYPWHVADYDSVSKSLIYVDRSNHHLVLVPAGRPAQGLAYQRPTPTEDGDVTFSIWKPRLSAGGGYVAYSQPTEMDCAVALSVKSLASPDAEPGRLVRPDGSVEDYAWSPSGELLAAVFDIEYGAPNDLLLYNARTKATIRLGCPTERTRRISRLAFVGPSQVCVLAEEEPPSGLQVWLADAVQGTWKHLDGGLRIDREALFSAGDGMLTYLQDTSLPGPQEKRRLVVRPIMESGDASETAELPSGSPAQLLLLGGLPGRP